MFAGWLAVSGCSHTTAYYRPDLLESFDDRDVEFRVLLIGDAGAPDKDGEPVLKLLKNWAIKNGRSLIVFLGDNVYERGLPPKDDPEYEEARRRLDPQLHAAKESRALFIPGNHDVRSNHGKSQKDYVEKQRNASYPITPGCPGPEKRDYPRVRIVALDTGWWLTGLKPGAKCKSVGRESVKQRLKEYVEPVPGLDVIVVAHHPLETHGTHGGFYDWQDHLFPLTRLWRPLWLPLPIVGSTYTLVRPALGVSQDLDSPPYQEMKRDLEEALSTNRPLLYAAGHDHSLQVLDGGAAACYAVVSGLGSSVKATPVSHGRNTMFAHAQHAGFMVVDFLRDGRVALRVVEVGNSVVFFRWLKATGSGPSACGRK